MPGTELYREIKYYERAERPKLICIFKMDAPLYYANAEPYRERLYEKCGIDLPKIMEIKEKVGLHLRILIFYWFIIFRRKRQWREACTIAKLVNFDGCATFSVVKTTIRSIKAYWTNKSMARRLQKELYFISKFDVPICIIEFLGDRQSSHSKVILTVSCWRWNGVSHTSSWFRQRGASYLEGFSQLTNYLIQAND